jgi:hypothetical protein
MEKEKTNPTLLEGKTEILPRVPAGSPSHRKLRPQLNPPLTKRNRYKKILNNFAPLVKFSMILKSTMT